MKKLNNIGFSVVEVSLILLIVGIIGGVGYYVYKNQNPDITESDSTVVTNSEETLEPETETDSSEGAPVQQLVVTEWGVKIPKESSVAGLAYTVNDQGLFYFRSSALNKYPVGDKNCENSVYVVRGTASEKVITETSDGDATFEAEYATRSSNDVAVIVGSYYYLTPRIGGASCAGASTEDQDKENAAQADIVKALNTMVAN